MAEPNELSVLASARRDIQLLEGGEQAFPRMIEAIAAAKRELHLEIYTFDSEGWGARFIDALTAAAERGVCVTVIVDGIGSFGTARELKRRLAGTHTSFTVFNPLVSWFAGKLWRNHRKILLVDDEVAFVGGINIHDDYASNAARLGWADLALELRGDAVQYLAHRLKKVPYTAKPGAVKVFLSGLRGGRRLRRRYVRAIGSAQKELLIAHAYFLPDGRFVRSITAAARRGVRVRLLLAGRSDVPLARAATMRLYRKFLTSGVEIYEWMDSTLHAKTAVVDAHRLLMGSFNLDPMSLVNLETLVEVDDPRVSAQVVRWVDEHIEKSRRVTLDECARSGVQRWLTDHLSLLLARLIESAAHFIGGSPLPRRKLSSGRQS